MDDAARSPWHGPFARRAMVGVTSAAVVVVLLLLAWRAVDVLLLLVAGILFALFLRGVGDLILEQSPAAPAPA